MPTRTYMGTTRAKTTLRAGKAAVGPKEPSRAVASSRGYVAGAAVEALADLFTAWPVATRRAALLTVGAMVTGSAHTGP